MSLPPGDANDRDLETSVAGVLRGGVILAALVIAAGGILFLIRHGSEPRDHRTFRGEPSELRSVTGIVGAALEFRGRAIIQGGLLLLIATPVARVVLAGLGFARERDFLYATVSLIVLLFLALSLSGITPG
jgi:uncharacterized membrane protein